MQAQEDCHEDGVPALHIEYSFDDRSPKIRKNEANAARLVSSGAVAYRQPKLCSLGSQQMQPPTHNHYTTRKEFEECNICNICNTQMEGST